MQIWRPKPTNIENLQTIRWSYFYYSPINSLIILLNYYIQFSRWPHAPLAKLESSKVWDTSCLAELINDLINRKFLCGKCLKTMTIQYLRSIGAAVVRYCVHNLEAIIPDNLIRCSFSKKTHIFSVQLYGLVVHASKMHIDMS